MFSERPELDTARPGWGSGRNRTLLALDPLDATSMDQLIDALVPDMPAEASSAIAAQAQGIPLFAVETIRTLVDRDVVVPRDGVYRLVGEVGTLTVRANGQVHQAPVQATSALPGPSLQWRLRHV